MTPIVRFAPSPTGYLHLGNARTAIVTWLFVRAHEGGQYILRIDDTDQERSKDEYTQAIKEDLTWLGLNWDRNEHQHGREERYNELIQKLKNEGRLYPCYETADELSLKRKALLGQGKPPIYDRAALKLTDDQIAKYEAEGRTPHWRFKLNADPIEWDDLVRGKVSFHGKDMSDPVLIRENGQPLYHICSVIDDIDYNITHVVRGEDHVSNTATHIQMFEALGATPPQFAHLALIMGEDGGKLSKREGSTSIRDLRDQEGIEAMAINCLLARTGTSLPIEAFTDIQDLAKGFDFSVFSRNAAKLSTSELERLNAKILHDTSFEEVQSRLPEGVDQEFWTIARANISKLGDVSDWMTVAKGPVTPEIDDADFAAQAATLLPQEPWDETTWGTWINAVKEETGRKGKDLFMPIRKALTGMAHGPELANLLPLIGYDRAQARLNGKELEEAA